MRSAGTFLSYATITIIAFVFGYLVVEIPAWGATAAVAATVHAATVPSFDPTSVIITLLGSLGLGAYGASAVAAYLAFSGVSSILMPWLPVPKSSTNQAYRLVYSVLNFVGAHNYRNASNAALAAQASPITGTVRSIVAPILILGIAAMTLTACQLTPSQIASDINLFTQSAQIVAPRIASDAGVSAVQVAAYNTALKELQAAASSVAADPAAASKDRQIAFVSAANDLLKVGASIQGLPWQVSDVLTAMAVFAPEFEQWAGISPPAGAAVFALKPSLPAARAYLRSQT